MPSWRSGGAGRTDRPIFSGTSFFPQKTERPRETADDLLQETWIDVYRKINRLQRPDAFTAWLYRIARDKAYRELRRPTSRCVRIDENLADSIASEEVSFTAEEVENVRAALDQLPLEQRDVLVLRFMEEMSYEQIAEVIARRSVPYVRGFTTPSWRCVQNSN